MKSIVCCTLFPSLIYAVAAAAPPPLVLRGRSAGVVPNRFIVEVDSPSHIPASRRSADGPHELLYRSLKTRGVPFQVDREFNTAGLFVGAALTLTSADDAVAVQQIPGVQSIRPVRFFSPPRPIVSHVVTGPGDPALPPDTESTHIMTGVDKLHAQGIIGSGIKIGIIDSGVDYTHPALGGGFGPGHKIVGGYDFVGDAFNGSNVPVPSPNPIDQCFGHGTHVAGIIGANPTNPFNISGVAYGASLSAYRIFGCNGSTTDDLIIQAMLRGVEDRQDILTLSIGGLGGWTESASSVVASRIADSGKVITVAAGNDGYSGAWFASDPGTAIDVISVASVDNTLVKYQEALVHGVKHDPIIYSTLFPLHIPSGLPIFATSNDTTVVNDACKALPATVPDLATYLVLVRRGGCPFVQKLNNIAARGAKFALIYNNDQVFISADVGNFTASLIQAADGQFLVQQFLAGARVSLSFPTAGGSVDFRNPTGGLVSPFSSYGPSNDFFFKPAISAPGGDILSTWPVPLGAYAVQSGTSMATPFVAGSAALLLSVKSRAPGVARGARTLFETTARSVASVLSDTAPLQTVAQQGAGLINVFDAIHATTIVSPGELILNDTAHFNGMQRISIRNTGQKAKKFSVTHIPAGTAPTIQRGSIFAVDGPIPLVRAAASVTLMPSSFTVLPGEVQTVIAVFRPPSGLDPSTFPVYSGFIQLQSDTETLHVTYLGLAASLRDKQVIDNTDTFFNFSLPAIIDGAGNVQDLPKNYTFSANDTVNVLFRLAFGTSIFRVDLVNPNINLKPTYHARAEDSRDLSFPRPISPGSFTQVHIVGAITEADFIQRNNDDPANPESNFYVFPLQQPAFANGTTIPNGQYRILIRALRVTGDPTKEEDYESWLSPIVGINAREGKH